MSNQPLVSIVTVNLNNLIGLRKTMASILGQTWKEFEYIIIDGGSTDGSREYIKSQSMELHYWVSEPDIGVYNAMNKGIARAKGTYLFFLNSGDWLINSSTLENIIPYLGETDVVYGNMIKVYPDGKKCLDKGVNGKAISLQTFVDYNLNHQATFIGKRLFSLYGFYDENLKIVSDWKFFLTALGLNNAKVRYVDVEISCFDMTGLSSDFKARDAERLKVIEELVPLPVYNDYLKMKEYEQILGSARVKKFLKTDQRRISRKLHSIIFRLFS